MASPAKLKKIGAEGFDLIDKHFGRFRKPQVPTPDVPMVVNSNEAASQFGGAKIDVNNQKANPPLRNWGRSLV